MDPLRLRFAQSISRACRVSKRPMFHISRAGTNVSSLRQELRHPSYITRRATPLRSMATASTSSATLPVLQPFKTHQPTSFPGSPKIHSFYDDPTATWTFVVADPATSEAIIVDPVLDFDPVSGRISQKSVKGLAGFVQKEGYRVVRICETHVHADHLTGAYALKQVSRAIDYGMTDSNPLTIGRHGSASSGASSSLHRCTSDGCAETISSGIRTTSGRTGQCLRWLHAGRGKLPNWLLDGCRS